MSFFGKIGKAIGGAFKAVGNGIKEVGKAVGNGLKEVGKQTALFAGGVVSGFVLKPVAGVVGLFNENLASKIKLPWQDAIDNSFMGKVGNFAGTALGFVAGTSWRSGAGLGATAARAAMGAVQGLGGSEGSTWDRIKGATFGALTAGVAGKLGDKVGAWVQKGEDAVLQPLVNAGAPRAVTQGLDRVMDAQVSSLLRRGRLADWEDLATGAAVSGVVNYAGDHIDAGLDKLMNRLPEGEVRNTVDRFVDRQVDSLERTGRFTDRGTAIAQALPDSLNQRIDRLLTNVNNNDNRFVQTAGQFLDNQVNTFREHGRFVDPRTGLVQATAREFAPELDRVVDRTRAMDNRVGDVMANVMQTEVDSLQRHGRLHNPGNALQRAVLDEVRPELNRVTSRVTDSLPQALPDNVSQRIDRLLTTASDPRGGGVQAAVVDAVRPELNRFGQHLPSPVRTTVNDMLDGFSIDGMNGLTQTAHQNVRQTMIDYGNNVLANRFQGPEPDESIQAAAPRVDAREVRA